MLYLRQPGKQLDKSNSRIVYIVVRPRGRTTGNQQSCLLGNLHEGLVVEFWQQQRHYLFSNATSMLILWFPLATKASGATATCSPVGESPTNNRSASM